MRQVARKPAIIAFQTMPTISFRRSGTSTIGVVVPRLTDTVMAMLYEDEEVLVLNKPAGLAVQGGTKTSQHVDRLLSAWGEGLERPRLVHRLDRDTSGVLVLGLATAPLVVTWAFVWSR